MKFVRYQLCGSVGWGVRRDETVYSLTSVDEGEPTWEQLADPGYREMLARQIERGAFETLPHEDLHLLPPVESPNKLVSIGLNYESHVAEQDAERPEQPLLFSKAPSAIVGPTESIVIPESVKQVDYEVELAVVIGQTARYVPTDSARECVAGYTILNDVSARDAQFEDGQFFRGKSYDTFAPLGPAIVTDGSESKDGFDPNDADLSLSVDGDQRQRANTNELIFDIDELLAFISSVLTLRPGDVVATGTPGGVGIFRDPPELLQPGDTVECVVEGIGTLENPVVAERT